MAEEGLTKTDNELIHIGHPIPFEIRTFLVQLRELMEISYANKDLEIIELVRQVVTTYHPTCNTDVAYYNNRFR